MTFEIPENLNPALFGLAWMIGRWEGSGKGSWTDGEFDYGQQIDIAENGGAYLHYLSQTFELDEGGKPVRPLAMETGFWLPQPDGKVDLVLSHPEGYAEIWYGQIDGAKIELTTDAVMRTKDAEPVTAGQRLYGNVEGDLLWTWDKATTDVDLQAFMWARLQRVGTHPQRASGAAESRGGAGGGQNGGDAGGAQPAGDAEPRIRDTP